MTWLTVGLAGGAMLTLAVVMGYILGWANRAFHVEVDPRIEQVNGALPGANCGGCGYVGCNEYAEAVVAGEAPADKCTVGGASCAAALAKILGVELEHSWPKRPVVHCAAHWADRLQRNEYRGERTCGSANIISGVQGCAYGCLGFGDCVRACAFDAIHVIDGLATVDYDKCVGCGACAEVCPRNIISMIPFKIDHVLVVACSNQDFGKDVKAVCKVGCIGCGRCAKANELFKMVDKLPQIDYADYDPETAEQLESVARSCPMGSLTFIGQPTAKDIEATADEDLPVRVEADFDTTVDRTRWQG
jgi:RnfABCDGE-type electron transport complex B subunit